MIICRSVFELPPNRRFDGELRSRRQGEIRGDTVCWGASELPYQIVAVRENETVSWKRISELIAIAKARVWTSEGWQVVIIDDEGRTLDAAKFKTPSAAQPGTLGSVGM